VKFLQNAKFLVYAQFVLIAGLLFWPDDRVGFGLLDFLFEFCGVLIVIIGVFILILSVRSLFAGLPKLKGTFFEQAKQAARVVWPEPQAEAKLVTTGLFKRMRHPIYSGLLWFAYGVGVASGPMPQLLFAIALHVVLYRKSLIEEEFLVKRFPEYAAYQARTGRFFPKVED
jgi:protein-S-isoprenylcysteine O-methyltransferase Ste14